MHFQQTVIEQRHTEFKTPYADSLLSLESRGKAKLSLTTTLFIGRLWRGGSIFFNPEASGTRWHCPDDRLGAAVVINGIFSEHRAYLATAGGRGFIIGNGQLNYGLERIAEVFYNLALPKYHVAIGPDYQFVVNSAYNRDRRSPVHVVAVRLHVEF